MADILTVTSLNLYVKSLLENDRNLFDIAVEGEVSPMAVHRVPLHRETALQIVQWAPTGERQSRRESNRPPEGCCSGTPTEIQGSRTRFFVRSDP